MGHSKKVDQWTTNRDNPAPVEVWGRAKVKVLVVIIITIVIVIIIIIVIVIIIAMARVVRIICLVVPPVIVETVPERLTNCGIYHKPLTILPN